jgi:hypothetical protein
LSGVSGCVQPHRTVEAFIGQATPETSALSKMEATGVGGTPQPAVVRGHPVAWVRLRGGGCAGRVALVDEFGTSRRPPSGGALRSGKGARVVECWWAFGGVADRCPRVRAAVGSLDASPRAFCSYPPEALAACTIGAGCAEGVLCPSGSGLPATKKAAHRAGGSVRSSSRCTRVSAPAGSSRPPCA